MHDSTTSLIKNETLLREKESEILRLQLELDETRTALAELQMASKSKVTRLETALKQKEELVQSLGNLVHNSKNSSVMLRYEEQLKKLETENTKLRKQVFALGVKKKQRTASTREVPSDQIMDMIRREGLDETPPSPTNAKAITLNSPLLSTDEKKEIFSRRRLSSKAALSNGRGELAGDESLGELTPLRERFEAELAEKMNLNQDSVSAYVEMVQQFETKLKDKAERLQEAETVIQALKKQVEDLEQAREKNKRRLKDNEEAFMNFLTTIDEQKGAILDLKRELKDSKEALASLTESTRKSTQSESQSQSSLAAMKMRAEELQIENRILTEQLSEQREINEVLKRESVETINTLQTQVGKKELEITKLNSKVETLLERNHEYLERMERLANAKNLANEQMEEQHSEAVKKLNEIIVGLKKELADVKLQKMFLEKNKLKTQGERADVDSFRVLENNGGNQSNMDENLGSEIGAISLKDSLRKVELDRVSQESLELAEMVNLKGANDSLDQPRQKRENYNHDIRPGNSPTRSRNSSIGNTPIMPKRKLSAENLSEKGNANSKQRRPEPMRVSGFASSTLRKTNLSPNPGEFVTGPSNLSDLCKDVDDPLLQYIQELDEKNEEIQQLRAELRRLQSDEETLETKKRLVTLELEVKHLRENLDQAEKIHAEEVAFHKQMVDEVTEQLTATKIRLSTMASEHDTVIINFNRRIKRLNYQISIYEGQISTFNESLKARQDG